MAIGKRRRSRPSRPYCCAVVPAAGQSSRMAGRNKLFYELDGVPLVVYTLFALNECPDIDEIVVAARPDDIVVFSQLCRRYNVSKIRHIVCGGETRAHSVLSGLTTLPPEAELAAIHDAARPFVSPRLISDAVKLAAQTGAAAPAVPPKDTIKLTSGGRVETTVPRESAMLVQTPQVFNTGLIKGALTRAIQENWNVSDDCGAVERMGMPVYLTEGNYENFKVTTPEDLILAEALIVRRRT